MNTGARTTQKLHLVMLSCGHIQRYRGMTVVPALHDRVDCLQCPLVDDKPQRATVRSSPKTQHPLDARCFGCSWRRRSSSVELITQTRAAKHASQHSHLVIVYRLQEEIRRYDCRQQTLEEGTPPF